MKINNVGVIGFGQIGRAIKQLASKKYCVFAQDINLDEIKDNKIDVLHLCFPFSKSFVKDAVAYINKINPQLVIIESTVAPNTTLKIAKKIKAEICHSPVRGVHPHLLEGIETFEKYIGPASKNSARMALQYFRTLGVKVKIFDNSLTTELAKLMCTTYYGWNIIFEKEMYKLCQKTGVNFDQAYTVWNNTYNAGYRKLGMKYVTRPILKHVDGPIGGHCVVSNCEILNKHLPNLVSRTITKANPKN